MEGLIHKAERLLRKSSPTVLSCVGIVGMVTTAVLAVRATPRAMEIYENLEDKTEKKGVVKATWRCYVPAIVTGVGTAVCIITANGLNKRNQASIASAYMLLDQAYREYRKKVGDLYGKDADEKVREEIIREKATDHITPSGSDTMIFYEDYYGQFFERTLVEVQDAEYQLNRKFALEGTAKLNDFYDFLGLEHTKAGETLGWDQETNEEFYNYPWIEFEHKFLTLDDGMECHTIDMICPPFLLS